mmetsp:Transcript_105149/g.307315  ORF Transcript_105149/g.307315 Transcript_105149/m.307315 type:complete len:576 (+) Transcript_105149:36-1763(+)
MASEHAPNVHVVTLQREEPLRSFDLEDGVHVDIFVEGDGQTFPREEVEANVVGRLLSGHVFEGNLSKGQPPMKMVLGKGEVIAGMEFGLRALSLGTLAELHIPSQLGYMHLGIPRIVPPNSDLIFEVDVLAVDGKKRPSRPGAASLRTPQTSAEDGPALVHPWWLARVQRPVPTAYYRNVCKYLARGVPPDVLARARPIPRKTRKEVTGWDLTGSAAVVTGVQNEWKASALWNLDWFKERLGNTRQFAKWQGPVFTKQENLWENPIWETSLAEYIDYIKAVDEADPFLEECNAPVCPRLYLNGWPAFLHMPWLREHIVNPTFVDDVSGELICESEELRESFLGALTQNYKPPSEEARQKGIDDEYWEMTKLFISPAGSLTRLHFDNGGAHAWLSQVRGRKLHVCFAPEDGPNLHAFEGDEGLLNGSWLDPLDPDVAEKWPDYAKAQPYIAVVEEGETIFAPQGWWHYSVALEASVTVMRNFFSDANRHEYVKRKDDGLISAFAMTVLKNQGKLKNQPDNVLKEISRKTVEKIREAIVQANVRPDGQRVRPSRIPWPGGPRPSAASRPPSVRGGQR